MYFVYVAFILYFILNEFEFGQSEFIILRTVFESNSIPMRPNYRIRITEFIDALFYIKGERHIRSKASTKFNFSAHANQKFKFVKDHDIM